MPRRPSTFVLNGDAVAVEDGISLLDALRDELGCRSVKDGCSPQGQCGCCTVWVDGAPRVACVTPVRRIAGRQRHHPRGSTGGTARPLGRRLRPARSQPVRLLHARHRAPAGRARSRRARRPPTRRDIEAALRAHLCRCTGWQSIVEAACSALGVDGAPPAGAGRSPRTRCWPRGGPSVEGPAFQTSGPDVVLGGGGFADDTAPPGGAGPARGGWAARPRPARRPGRERTRPGSQQHGAPVAPGRRARGRLGPHAADDVGRAGLRRAGRQLVPARPRPRLAAGQRRRVRWQAPEPGALRRARELADATGDAVRVLWRREDVVRRGPKRPPLAVALRADGTRRRARRPHGGFGRPGAAGGRGAGVLPRRGGRARST